MTSLQTAGNEAYNMDVHAHAHTLEKELSALRRELHAHTLARKVRNRRPLGDPPKCNDIHSHFRARCDNTHEAASRTSVSE